MFNVQGLINTAQYSVVVQVQTCFRREKSLFNLFLSYKLDDIIIIIIKRS